MGPHNSQERMRTNEVEQLARCVLPCVLRVDYCERMKEERVAMDPNRSRAAFNYGPFAIEWRVLM